MYLQTNFLNPLLYFDSNATSTETMHEYPVTTFHTSNKSPLPPMEKMSCLTHEIEILLDPYANTSNVTELCVATCEADAILRPLSC